MKNTNKQSSKIPLSDVSSHGDFTVGPLFQQTETFNHNLINLLCFFQQGPDIINSIKFHAFK